MTNSSPRSPGLIRAPTPSAVIGVQVLFLVLTASLGGPAWTLAALVPFVLAAIDPSRRSGRSWVWLGLALSGLAWPAISRYTSNRELFFPYSMHLAACAWLAAANRGWWAGLVAACVESLVFLGIRFAEGATLRVLAVEAAVATATIAAGGLLQAIRTGAGDRELASGHRIIDAATVAIMAWLATAGLLL